MDLDLKSTSVFGVTGAQNKRLTNGIAIIGRQNGKLLSTPQALIHLNATSHLSNIPRHMTCLLPGQMVVTIASFNASK